MYNASERKDIRRAEKAQEVIERARIEFIVAAMSTPQGRTWFHDLLAGCRIFSDPFTGDSLVEAYHKGERNVGLRIYGDIVQNCPKYFVMMMEEATIRDQTNAERYKPASTDGVEPVAEPDDSTEYDLYSEPVAST